MVSEGALLKKKKGAEQIPMTLRSALLLFFPPLFTVCFSRTFQLPVSALNITLPLDPAPDFPLYHTTVPVPHHFSVGVVFSDSIPCLWAGVIFGFLPHGHLCISAPCFIWPEVVDLGSRYVGSGVC